MLEIIPTNILEVKNGSFILAEFKGGKRNTTTFKYVCSVEKVEGSNIEVVGLKCTDETKMDFVVDSKDVSFISEDQLIGLLPFPTIKMKGERIYYHFEKKVPINENSY